MNEDVRVRHEFVEFIPAVLEEGVIYVSIPYKTAVHRCCCGCGSKVITPLAPRRWKLTFDGETISLRPSIGNWSFPCQAHYWITNDSIEWAGQLTQKEIAAGRAREDRADGEYFDSVKAPVPKTNVPESLELISSAKESALLEEMVPETKTTQGVWDKLRNWVHHKFHF